MKKLTPEEYAICRQKGTEAPFTGKYWNSKEAGMYVCKCCGNKLFSSEKKYESGTGWPSFYDVMPDAVSKHEDTSHNMQRVEVTCQKCGSHLGHVFNDGPHPTGLRYCINSASLDLQKKEDDKE